MGSKESLLKGKNLLLNQQILSFKISDFLSLVHSVLAVLSAIGLKSFVGYGSKQKSQKLFSFVIHCWKKWL